MDICLKVNNDNVSTESTEYTPEKNNKKNDIEILFQSDSSVTQNDSVSDSRHPKYYPKDFGSVKQQTHVDEYSENFSENTISEAKQVFGGIYELKKASDFTESRKSKTAAPKPNSIIEGIIDLSNAKSVLEKKERIIKELETNPRYLDLANKNGKISLSNSSTSVYNEEFMTINEIGKNNRESNKNNEMFDKKNIQYEKENSVLCHDNLLCSSLESKVPAVDTIDYNVKSSSKMLNATLFKIEKSIVENHIETNNKLDQILRYIESELDVEKSKRLVLERKLESINKLLKNHEKELGL